MFHKSKPTPMAVTDGRLEIERGGHVAWLQYTLAGKTLQLIHTEVPEELREQGLATELAESALKWAREQNLKVDVVCPSVNAYLESIRSMQTWCFGKSGDLRERGRLSRPRQQRNRLNGWSCTPLPHGCDVRGHATPCFRRPDQLLNS